MRLRDLSHACPLRCIVGDGTLLISSEEAESVLRADFPGCANWYWPIEYSGVALLYVARGPGRSVKVGLSSKPYDRILSMNGSVNSEIIGNRLRCEPGPHRLELVIAYGGRFAERALHDLLAAERVSGEWFRGERSEFLLSTLARVATPAMLKGAA